MKENYLKRYAALLADYCLSVGKNEKILIRSSYLAEDLINEFCSIAYSRGAHPETKIALRNSERLYYENSSTEDLKYLSETELNYYKNFDAFLTIRAPFDAKELQGISAEKKKVKNESAKILHELFSERSSNGTLKWCVCQYPTESQASESGMSLAEYEDFIIKSAYLDKENPVECWDELSAKQGLIADYLNNCSEVRIKNDATDIVFSCKGRIWINSDGRRNMPSGEIFTSPVESSVNGFITFSYPAIYMGEEVQGVKLTVKDGKIIAHSAQKGEDLLSQVLKIEGAESFGEAAIGTNYGIENFTKNILFDEKIGGTVHFALGDSYAETGGKNRSAIHWDMIADMRSNSVITADGKLIYKNGHFTESFLRLVGVRGDL